MASAPAQLPTQRRSSPEQSSSTATTSDQTTLDTRPGESQTIFENNPSNEADQQEGVEKDQEPQIGTNVPPLNINDDPSIKKCWICFSDSTEDTPESSPWRDPCPCALQAHEECLLDWIADIEAPRSARQRGAVTAPKIECPQCKAEIKLERPRNYIVDAVGALERLADKASFPGMMIILGGMLWTSSTAWGVRSIYAVFGVEDGFRILAPHTLGFAVLPSREIYLRNPEEAAKAIQAMVQHNLRHWRLHLGLPLISPLLILSRTHLADSYLPMVPIIFFASQAHSPRGTLDFRPWPPSASFAFAVLPYVRALYNYYYEKVWAEKSRRWLREVQPRAGGELDGNARAQDAGANAGDAVAPPAEDGNIFEVRIDGGIFEDWVDEEGAEVQVPGEGREEDPGAPGPDAQANRPEPQIPAAPLQAEQPAAARQPGQPLQGAAGNAAPAAAANNAPDNAAGVARGERRLSFSPTAIIETVIGALLFPTIAGIAGETLKLVLPSSWTTVPVPSARFASRLWPRLEQKISPRGFLSHKWARSIVGGCLVVVCKDAIMLYVRWKLAQMHRHRKVMDSPEKKKKQKKRETGRAGEAG
jgi:hypothetical protein